MIEHKGNLLIFGGSNGSKTLNDMWTFDLAAKKWTAIDNKSTPEVFLVLFSLVEVIL
jgi:UDP-N-acetylglucosamine:LPS N-acetylglucosamine transferase